MNPARSIPWLRVFIKGAVILSASLAVAVCAGERPSAYFVNAAASQISYGINAADFEDVRPVLLPGEREGPWQEWPTTLFVERDILGADPLQYVLDSLPPLGGEGMLLVFKNYSLYVVPESRWSPPLPQSEEAVANLAVLRILPLD